MALQTVDVAIGMVFVYLLLTLIASTLVEMISSLCNWRGEMLYKAIAKLLAGTTVTVDVVYATPFIRSLGRSEGAVQQKIDFFERRGWRTPSEPNEAPPSYIPPAAFSSAVLSVLWHECRTADTALPLDKPEITALQIGEYADQHFAQTTALGQIIATTLATQGPSIQALRLAIEKSFNDCMDRASGWYKRRTQLCLLLIGIFCAFAGNIDSINIARWLWNSNAAREAVVAAAMDASKQSMPQVGTFEKADPKNKQGPNTAIEFVAKDFAAGSARFEAMQLPVGWPSRDLSILWFIEYLFGCLVSGIAVSVGSSFWFDALQSLVKIRATGPRPTAR